MSMTRKDFEAIAYILKCKGNLPEHYDRGTVQVIAMGMADYLSTTNPRFDRSRFMRACGL